MTAYIVALIDVKDPAKYQGYGEAFEAGGYRSFIEDYGGEFLVISDEAEAIEGEWTGRLVVMKFPDADKARGWYESPEYHDVRKIRWASATTNMALFPGFDLQAAISRALEAR